jgi:hypothetical protein
MKTTIELPLLPLRDVVVYPHMVIPLFVGREIHRSPRGRDDGRQADPAAGPEKPC